MSKRIPPNDVDIEQAVIGSCFLSEEALAQAVESLDAEFFYNPAHRLIFRYMLTMFSSSEPVDMLTVVSKLRDDGSLDEVGGAAYIAQLTNMVPMSSGILAYCKIIREKYVLRELISHCSLVIDRCFEGGSLEEITDYAESGMFDLVSEHSKGVQRISTLVDESIELLKQRCNSDGGVTGIPTGFRDLDKKTAGMQPGDLVILAARPSMGKTALAMNIAKNAAMDHKRPALVFSLEMSGQQLTERMLAGCAEVDGQGMRTGFLKDGDWPKITRAAGLLSNVEIFIDDESNLSVIDVRARARRVKSKYDISMILIDYLQLMRGSSKDGRTQEVAEISRGLKALAKELKVPVVALSQLNRSLESRTDKRPVLSDLRESGALEQDADVIMFLYRDEYYHPGRGNEGLAELIIGKQRCGPIGAVKLMFQKELSTFRSLAYGS